MSRCVTLFCLLLVVAAAAALSAKTSEEERPNLIKQAAENAWSGAEMVLGKDTMRALVKGSNVIRRQIVSAVDAGLDFLARLARDFLEILGYKDADIWALFDLKALLASPGSLLALLVALFIAYQLLLFVATLACAAALSLLGPLFVRVVRLLLLCLLAAYLSVKYESEPEKAAALMAVAAAAYLYSGSRAAGGGAGDWQVDARLRGIDDKVAKLSRRIDGIERRGGGANE